MACVDVRTSSLETPSDWFLLNGDSQCRAASLFMAEGKSPSRTPMANK